MNQLDLLKSEQEQALPVTQVNQYSTKLSKFTINLLLSTEDLKTTDYDVNSAAALRNDMERCSLAMGISKKHLELQNLQLGKISQSAAQFLNVMYSILPKTFLPNMKNPCWYSNVSHTASSNYFLMENLRPEVGKGISRPALNKLTQTILNNPGKKTLLCLPYFFIAGFPKSATSTLDIGMRKHPQIVGPSDKEPHWWTRGLHFKEGFQDNGPLSVVRYTLFFTPLTDVLDFSDVGGGLVTYDASQSTLWDSPYSENDQDYCILPTLMSRILPGAKFVVLMRNPVDRLISHFIWSCKYHHGNDMSKWPADVVRDGPDVFHAQVVRITNWFSECLEMFSLFKCVNSRDFGVTFNSEASCGTIGHRLLIGIYFVHLSKWLQFYSEEQFLFLRMEDFVSDPFETLSQVTDFLGVSPVTRSKAEQWFSEKTNQRDEPAKSAFHIRDRTVELLKSFYRPYNLLLSELLNDNKFLWNS